MSETAIYQVLERPWLYRWTQAILAPGADENITRCIRELVKELPSAHRLLDVGCGPSSWLWRAGLHPVGLDVSPAYVASFRSRGTSAVIGSAAELPFAADSFDGVWCIGVLHHLDNESARRAVREMGRVCRTGGYAVIFDGVRPDAFWRRPLAWLIRRLDRGAYFRDESSMRSLLQASSWRTTRLTYAATGLEGMVCVSLKHLS